MKTFIKQSGLFFVLSFVVLQGVGWLLIQTGNQGQAVENSGIYTCLEKSRRAWPETDVFVFGDSVARQMYPPETTKGRINSLALVMPSTLAGQYFLLKRLASTNDLDGKTMVLIWSPEWFSQDLSHESSYHYVLKPFHNDEFKPWEDAFYQERMSGGLLAPLSQWPMIKCSNWNPPRWMSYLNEDLPAPKSGMSLFSEHFLRLIMEVLSEEKAVLRLLPTVQPQSKAGISYERLRSEIQQAGLGPLFSEYFHEFHYISDKLFLDGVHVKNRDILGGNMLGL